MGLTLLVGIPVSALAGDAVTGIVAGVGAGGVAALRRDHDETVRARVLAVLFAAVYTFVLVRVGGGLVVLLPAPIFPFTAIGIADHLSERNRERERTPSVGPRELTAGRPRLPPRPRQAAPAASAERRTTRSVRSTTPAGSAPSSSWASSPAAISRPELLDRLADGRQRRVGGAGQLAVVEADHRHLAGDLPAGGPQGVERAESHEVGRHEQGVDVGAPAQQRPVARAPPSRVKSASATMSSAAGRPAAASACRPPGPAVDAPAPCRPARPRCRSPSGRPPPGARRRRRAPPVVVGVHVADGGARRRAPRDDRGDAGLGQAAGPAGRRPGPRAAARRRSRPAGGGPRPGRGRPRSGSSSARAGSGWRPAHRSRRAWWRRRTGRRTAARWAPTRPARSSRCGCRPATGPPGWARSPARPRPPRRPGGRHRTLGGCR